ncbi:MAG: polyvinylalcohol dehydrogenase [Verrucomicrobiales bacterium]|nr:polyvinylalcohol dehydrogenase [Verrucomicrobiales bacterium]
MISQNIRLLLVAGLIALASSVHGGDWPQWRGPNRDGKSTDTGLLKQWPEGGPKQLWKATGLGGGYSTPSVVEGRVFGSGYRGEEEYIWALDASSGKEIWSTKTGGAEKKVGYPEGPRSTPTIDGDSLFTLSAGGNLVCLDTTSGKERWHHELKKEFGGRMMSGWGFSESPLVDGNKVVCTPGSMKGTVLALNKKTGEVIWQSAEFVDKSAYASLVVANFGGVRQYVQLTDAHVAGIAAADGKLLWQADRPGKTAVIPTPIVTDEFVYVTSGYGVGCNLFKVTKGGDGFKVEEVYANKNLINHHGGVVLVGNHIYGHSEKGGWTCQDLKSGEVVWANNGVGKGSISFADGFFYIRSESKGSVALIEASPKGYKEHGRFDQPDRSSKNSWPHPVIENGKLYLRDQDAMFCYDVKGQ